MCAVLILNFLLSSPVQNTNTREKDMKAGKFYLVFPTAILQRLLELFFRSWLPGEDRADKQSRFRYHCDVIIGKGLCFAWKKNACGAMISGHHLTDLRLRSACWLDSYWQPCLALFYLWLKFSRIKSAILIATSSDRFCKKIVKIISKNLILHHAR